MQSVTRGRRIASLEFYIAVVALGVMVWLIERHLNTATFPPNTIISSSSSDSPSQSWLQMGIQAASETARLLTTLATALLGALGLLLVNRNSDRPKPRHLWSAFLAAMCAGVSLYFGYVVHSYLVAMIYSENFDAYHLKYPSYYQFYGLLLGALFLADFAFHDLSAEN